MAESNLIKHFTDSTMADGVKSGITLVDFHANWCGPCRTLAPVLEQVAKDVTGSAQIAKVDIDTEQQTAQNYKITSVPTMILFKDGKEVGRLIGLRTAEDIKKFINSAK